MNCGHKSHLVCMCVECDDALRARISELEKLLAELLVTDGGEGSEGWDATRFLAARKAARALLPKVST